MSSGYVMPAACHSFGYIEIGVKPGHRVDLVAQEAAAALLEEEVDPGEAVAAQHLEDPHGERPHLVGLRRP